MSTPQNNSMRLLDAALHKYEAIGRSNIEFAISNLLTDLRHYCDDHDIDFDDRVEESLDVFLDEDAVEEE
jgi:hypothetical protein